MAKPPQIQPLGTMKFVRMALVAKSGFGKTVFCGTAPNALFITTDPEGTISAQGFGSQAEEWKVKSWQEIEEAYIWLRDEGIESEGYEWVIIDDATNAQAFAMQEALEIAVRKNANRDPYVPDKLEYQRSQNAFINMVKKFNDLPVNIIYTSLRKGMEDGDGQEYFSAAIQGQQGALAEQFLAYMNITGFGEVVEKEGEPAVRRYYFIHHKAYRGKCRIARDGKSVLGNYKDNFTVPEMMKLINGSSVRSIRPAKKAAAAKTTTRRTTARATR